MELLQIGKPCCGDEAAGGSHIDPVCGMTVDPATAAGSFIYAGHEYYFCSRHCLEKFKANPAAYVGQARKAEHPHPGPLPKGAGAIAGGATGTKYTCPMHTEIVQDGQGTCPKCGMALEPMEPTAEEGPDPELLDMQRRFWIGAALTLPIFAIAMAGLLPWTALQHWLHANMAVLNWVQLVLATPVVLWCGWPFFQRAWASVVHRSPNMFTFIPLVVEAGSTIVEHANI